MLPRRLIGLCVLLMLGACALVRAQVEASLVAAETSIQPGRPFTVALRLQHQAHWHTYWINPGTGYPTELTWELPAGWKAGPIQWPTPLVVRDRRGSVTGNGYEGDTLLPVTLTPPDSLAAGSPVVLRAKASWLMCADTCVPGDAKLQLMLPVKTEAPAADSTWGAKLAAVPLPQTPEPWKLTATRGAKTVTLLLQSADAKSAVLNSPHFFSEDNYIQYDQPQSVKQVDGGYEFTLPISATIDKPSERLVGVIATQAPLAGLRVDVPFQTASAAGKFSLATLFFGFLGGLVLNLMPCVFPVLGIKILGFVNQAGAERRKVVMHGLAFTAGALLCFWILAGFIALLKAGGSQIGWGAQLQYPNFVFGLAIVMLVFGLSMSGVFEFGLSATGIGAGLQSKAGYTGTFFTGALATVVATPCSAPFLAPALGTALALPTAQSFAVFTAIGLGLSFPYLALSLFPQAVKFLPRPGEWMETFKQGMAFLLYGTVAWLVWVLDAQVTENSLLMTVLGLTVVAMGVWLYGRYTRPEAKRRRPGFATVAGLAVLSAGVALGWPETPAQAKVGAGANAVVWEPWSPERVAALQKDGRTVYVDFTARWCATCQTNKTLVFSSDEVRRTFQEKKVATLKADWTNQDPAITAELAKYGRAAVPFNLLYKAGAAEPVVLPEFLTAGTVLDALK